MRLLWLLVLALVLPACQQGDRQSDFNLGNALGGKAAEGFARAMAPRRFVFPRDHHAHPAYRNEWWYLTGNLQDEAGRRYGYQVTLFRIALSPRPAQSDSRWATHQVWMAHVALTDVDADRYLHAQRLARGAMGLAGQDDAPFRVWLEDWQIVGQFNGRFPWHVQVKAQAFALDLKLAPEKPAVLQGDKGLSRKSGEPGNASYYYSFTRLKTRGTIRSKDDRHQVHGLSWLDREWSTSALADNQVGWDWFSLQLNDGNDLMFYRLRDKDGTTDPYSAGSWVNPQGTKQALMSDDVELTPLRFWHSADGRDYPVAWELRVASLQKRFHVEALVDDQEMKPGIVYWEGAVRVRDGEDKKTLGYGYLEMTGY
jgi:predicted secreted hydrolase